MPPLVEKQKTQLNQFIHLTHFHIFDINPFIIKIEQEKSTAISNANLYVTMTLFAELFKLLYQ